MLKRCNFNGTTQESFAFGDSTAPSGVAGQTDYLQSIPATPATLASLTWATWISKTINIKEAGVYEFAGGVTFYSSATNSSNRMRMLIGAEDGGTVGYSTTKPTPLVASMRHVISLPAGDVTLALQYITVSNNTVTPLRGTVVMRRLK